MLRGAALQCRITTEDPANNFRPDTGRITTYRSPGGAGIRLDGGTTYTGAEISPHFDSMLAKLTCRGRTYEKAVERARRALAEFRIRGVSTNIAFLQALLDDPDFQAGRVTTSFIETHPDLLTARSSGDRGTKLLTYLADVTVNQPHGPAPVSLDPVSKLPDVDLTVPAPDGTRQALLALGPQEFAAPAARAGHGRRHRHHVPRRPPVAAGHAGAHPRPARRRRPRRPDDPAAVVAGGLGRGDVRRGVAVPVRGPVGAAGQAPPGRAEPLSPDAAARAQHRGLHAVPGRGDQRLRRGGRGHRHRRVPDLRRAQRRRADAAGDRRRAVDRRRPSPRSRSATPATCPTRARSSTRSTTTSASRRGSWSPGRTCWRSRTWPACCARRPRGRW